MLIAASGVLSGKQELAEKMMCSTGEAELYWGKGQFILLKIFSSLSTLYHYTRAKLLSGTEKNVIKILQTQLSKMELLMKPIAEQHLPLDPVSMLPPE